MGDLINIFIKSAFIENLALSYFLGMCSFLAVSKSVKTAFGLGIAVIFVQSITIPVNWLSRDSRRKAIGKRAARNCWNRPARVWDATSSGVTRRLRTAASLHETTRKSFAFPWPLGQLSNTRTD